MNRLMAFIDSLLFSVKSRENLSKELVDPTVYVIETNLNTYCGIIIYQDDTMIKFRTSDLKPVKILKKNVKQVSIFNQTYLATG